MDPVWIRNYGVETIWIRFHNLFDPNRNTDKIVWIPPDPDGSFLLIRHTTIYPSLMVSWVREGGVALTNQLQLMILL